MGATFDFSGYATKFNRKCADGRTIRKNAFNENDGCIVPLVWQHQHNDPMNVLGHVLLETRDDGVYAYGTFNDTEQGRNAKELVQHKDVTALSIYANKLKQNGGDVLHGVIREVSLVLAGANPEAFIDFTSLSHGDAIEDEAVIYTDEIIHSADEDEKKNNDDDKPVEVENNDKKIDDSEGENEMANEPQNTNNEKTVKDVFDELTEEQKNVVYFLIEKAVEDATGNGEVEGDNTNMKHNVFDNEPVYGPALSHDDMKDIISNAKRCGSLRDAFMTFCDYDEELAHAITDHNDQSVTYGMANIDYLFPDAKAINPTPGFIKRPDDWVARVMNGVHHTPFSRIKSIFADITEDDARAKGYIKGKQKKEEVFSLLKRTTTPTTVYKKQKLDRDDVVDITDFDVVAWLKQEMRMMLDEELARAILVGDGRSNSSDDKINELNIRPIYTDDKLYTIHSKMEVAAEATPADIAKLTIDEAVRQRKNYKGSGNPTLFTTEDYLTEALLLEDKLGHKLYKNVDELATAMRVKEIITVPVMEGAKRKDGEDQKEYILDGIIVNLNDYNVGADKQGAVNLFDDFDIDYNAMKYLIETRCSGAMVTPYGAIVLEHRKAE